MPTYLDTVVRIEQDLLNRTQFSDAVKRSIQTTIRHYERQKFAFNTTQTALVAVANVETVAKPSDFLTLDRLEYTWNGNSPELIRKPLDYIRKVNIDQATGTPSWFCEYGENFYLANVPDSAYVLPCFYIQKLPALSADTDTNKWLSCAEDLIVFGAAKLVWATTIRNASAAGVCAQLEQSFATELYAWRDEQQKSQITPTRF